MGSMTKPVLRLGLVVTFVLPAVAITRVAETTFELGPDATFGLLMLTSILAAVVADRVARTRTDRGRDEGDG